MSEDKSIDNGEILLYQTEDGQTNVQVRLKDDTVWLTQADMSELFQTTKQNINLHINNILRTGELQANPTVKEYLTVQEEGNRLVQRQVAHYSLDMIISVGYRVNSHRGTQFRIWASERLKEYLVKGFTMNDTRLAHGPSNYFDELVARVRAIRTSEKNFYLKVRDIFATSIDYDSNTDLAKTFYSTVQNKFHYAIHGQTSAELITSRIDAGKPNLGLTNWSGKIVTAQEAKIAKNYLEALELKRLELLVEQFLSFAELRSVEKKPMYMVDWNKKLDDFLRLNDKEILQNAGSVSHKDMEEKVRIELGKFHALTREKQPDT